MQERQIKTIMSPVSIYQVGEYVLIHTGLLNLCVQPFSSMAGGNLNQCHCHVWKENAHTTHRVSPSPSPRPPENWQLLLVEEPWTAARAQEGKEYFAASLLCCLKLLPVHELHSQKF